jgi:hypothetical protein
MVGRFRADGIDGLRDRSSRPHSLPGQTPPATCTAVDALRRQRYTGKQIAAELGISTATVSRFQQRQEPMNILKKEQLRVRRTPT